ncbi:DNA recombination protein RmuC [Candidatus Parcubacteria bacterium]|nr:DNA recombination protein RmuC [Candidatus Parcubacteria bacterium]
MSDIVLILTIFLIIAGGIGFLFFFFKKEIEKLGEKKDDDSLTKIIEKQITQSTKVIENVTEKLTKLENTNKQVVGFAQQLQSLENILKNPKQRGILGEYYLEELLKNVFSPNQYQMQYAFKDGQIVDAAIFIKDKILPIDSKFSLENYNKIVEEKDAFRREQLEKIFKQDLKNRIDETAKYVRPEEGTLDFAFMFIPAEAIYYDLLVNKVGAVKSNTRDLVNYAVREKHVHIVSPTSFYAYLQTILQGLRAMQIEESAKEIRKGVEMLGRHIVSYEEYMQKLGNNLGTTVNAYNKSYKELSKIDKDIAKITQGKKTIKPLELEKPEQNL